MTLAVVVQIRSQMSGAFGTHDTAKLDIVKPIGYRIHGKTGRSEIVGVSTQRDKRGIEWSRETKHAIEPANFYLACRRDSRACLANASDYAMTCAAMG